MVVKRLIFLPEKNCGAVQASILPRIALGSIAALVLQLAVFLLPAKAEKDATQYGMGLIVNVPFSESEVTQVVQDIIQNGIIRGTKEYNNDEYLKGATPASSTRAFKEWTEGGKVFYKIRLKTLDPRNFKNSGDLGTLAVRYVVQAQGEKNTVLRIDAVFVEEFRHVTHPSNGSVEGAEYKDIHDHLESIELIKAETVEAQQGKQKLSAQSQPSAALENVPATAPVTQTPARTSTLAAPPTEATSAAPPSQTPEPHTLEQRVRDLRRQVQRLVKAPGAPLKSAPFHTATTLQSLPTGAEVLVVISTTYWLGVETHEGQHGWILRDDLELLP